MSDVVIRMFFYYSVRQHKRTEESVDKDITGTLPEKARPKLVG